MSIDRGMDKEDMVHIYNGVLVTKKGWIMPFATTWMDLEIVILNEISQRKTNVIWFFLHVESKTKNTNELIYKREIESHTQKMNIVTMG